MNRILIAAAMLLVVAVPGQAASKGLLRDDPTPNPWRPDCLPASEFALDGVRLWDSAAAVRAAKGAPAETGADSYGHADRHFDFEIWEYADISVSIARNDRTGHDTAFGMETGASGISTASGIRPGMSWGDVVAVLGRAPREKAARSGGGFTHSISRCPDPGMDARAVSVEDFPDTMHLRFDGAGILRAIEIRAGI